MKIMQDILPQREKSLALDSKIPVWNRIFPINSDIALWSMAIVWGSHFLLMIARNVVMSLPSPMLFAGQYGLIVVFCVAMTWLVYRLLVMAGRHGISRSIFLLIIPILIFSICAAYLEATFVNIAPGSSPALDWSRFFDKVFIFSLLMAGWGGSYLALAHSRTTKLAVEHSRELEKLTRDSQLRALRFQLNPHFVFNALNSISSLIIDKSNQRAEQLVGDLADYMRVVLNDDGTDMVSVEQEIAQQVRYLEIEKTRFPERLVFEAHVDENVKNWSIPTLIIQPLIENAIKYGVANTTQPVRIIITAQKDGPNLKLSVANDGRLSMEDNSASGTGTGLQNIRERLAALYGHSAALLIANSSDGMTVANIVLPAASQILEDVSI